MAVHTTFSDDSDCENLLPILEIDNDTFFVTLCIGYSKIDTFAEERIICLNKQSAIKLAKELRKQISFLEG